jgi:hypothetical protein
MRHQRTPFAELFADLPKLLQDTGASAEEVVAALERDDGEAIARLSERVMRSPTMANIVLGNIRRAEEHRNQN